jgi:phosphoribosylformylglycinamidine synthase
VIHKFSVRPAGDGEEPGLSRLRVSLGLPDLRLSRDYYLEFEEALGPEQVALVAGMLGGDEIGLRVAVDEPLEPGTMVQVSHRRGVVDNESDTLVAMCGLLGLRARAGKVAVTYRSGAAGLAEVIRAARFNPATEDLHLREPVYETLVPLGHYAKAETFDLLALDDDALAVVGRAGGRNLGPAQMRRVRQIQRACGGAPVTDVLLEALDARWSDHCSHTTWRSLGGGLLRRLVEASTATRNPNIVSMFHDNAGVWDFYAGYALAIKAETHNGPSAVSAYFGQLTKLGGVLRDILGTGLGADPIGCFEYTATGLPEEPAPIAGRPSPRQIAVDTIRAIKEYGNTFGVPMMSSRMSFHPGYRAKPFALGGSVGILPTGAAGRGEPRPGDLVVLIGGLTGNEGIHGASASSAGATMDEAAVQIGAPLEQVKFRKAIVDLRDAGCLRALTDVGGAGLNSAVGEIGDPCGVWLNTAVVPLKTRALPMWRILLSESQERMLLAIPPQALPQARRITARHQVRTTVIGRFSGNGRYSVFHAPDLTEDGIVALPDGQLPTHHGEPGFDVPYTLLDWEPPPQPTGPVPVPEPVPGAWPDLAPAGVAALLHAVAGDAEICSQLYADSQYDSTVQGNTCHGPHYGSRHPVPASYWAARPVDGHPGAVVFTTAFQPWLYDLHPVHALRQMFCALLGRQVLAGVSLVDICLCDNFYTPHLSEHAAEWLVGMVDELATLVRHFGTPVISGKDSSAGSTPTDQGTVHVPPAVFLSGMGKVPDHATLLGEAWTTPGNLLVHIGPDTPAPAGTAAARALNLPGNQLDHIDLDDYLRYLHAIPTTRHMFASAVPIGPGGLAAKLITGTLATGLGADLDGHDHTTASLFAEHRTAALVEIAPADLAALPDALHPRPVATLTTTPGINYRGGNLLSPAVRDRFTDSFAARLA